jgi:RNA polymerase sigma-70 factor (ECF subfamily)
LLHSSYKASVARIEEDYQLMQRVAAHDRDAARTVALRVVARLHHVARRLLGERGEVEDATQAALVEVLASAGTYEGRVPIEAWAAALCARVTLRAATRRRRLVLVPQVADSALFATSIGAAPDFHALLAKLEEPRRTTVWLRFGMDCSIDDIAQAMGTSPNTVKARLKEALKTLRAAVLVKEEA